MENTTDDQTPMIRMSWTDYWETIKHHFKENENVGDDDSDNSDELFKPNITINEESFKFLFEKMWPETQKALGIYKTIEEAEFTQEEMEEIKKKILE